MANGMDNEQIQRYIQESSDRVADVGWDNADLKDVLMMAVGFMKPTKSPKKLIAGGMAGGAAVIVGVFEAVKAFLG